MINTTKVSILCLTYNHEKFIEQTLDSFFNQKTNFDFEILIHDDASTDNTLKIIRTYQKKYSKKIRLFTEKENQFSKGIRGFISKILIPSAKGEYLALCEGDDFFTDKNKLQLQVDFLDKNPDYSLCFHPVNVFFENKEEKEYIFPKGNIKNFTLKKLLKENYIQTNSVMYRRQKYYNLPKTNFLPGDWYLHLYHAKYGKIGFINNVMSTYRRHPQGLWWNVYKDIDKLIIENGQLHLILFLELIILFNKNEKYKNIILDNFKKLLSIYIESVKNKENKVLQLKNEQLQLKNEQLQLKNEQLQLNLNKIQSSKTYKIWQKYNDVLKKLKLK